MKKSRSFITALIPALSLVLVTIALASTTQQQNPPPQTDGESVQPTTIPPEAHLEGISYLWDFEADNGGFTGTLDWEWGTYAWIGATCFGTNNPPPSAHSGGSMWGTVLNDCYANRGNNSGYNTCINDNPTDDSILSFTLDLTGVTGQVELSWWEWYDLFMDWDWAEVYVNGEVVFHHCGGGYVVPTEWQQQVVDLTPYTGGLATIEFHMMASTVVNYAGWYIDDVMIRSPLESTKDAPAYAQPGEVITYSILITTPMLENGMYMTDTLPAGVAYAGNLAWSDGLAWYDSGTNTVRWEYNPPQTASAPITQPPTITDTQVEITFNVTVTADCGAAIVNEGIAGNDKGVLIFTATTRVRGNCDIVVDPQALEVLLPADTISTLSYEICNLGVCPLDWRVYETTRNQVLKPVLIIQDQYPWDYDSIQHVLEAHDIGYEQVGSSQIPTVTLSLYDLVIIPSNQPNSFYTIWNANLAKFEDYVNAGGALWLSTCAFSATTPEPLMPGGVINSTDLDWHNDIVAPAHPWVAGVPSLISGDYASHDSFTNLLPGSIVVAQAQTSHNPTLVDYTLGNGRILITGQTLEITWALRWDGAPILENSLLDMYLWAYTTDIPWLSESPITGTLTANDCQTETVTFDTSGLMPGDYWGDLLILNNDPDTPQEIVPITLTVYLPVDLAVDKTAAPNLVHVGEALIYTVTVVNTGPGDATMVTLTDTLPTVAFGAAVPSQGTCDENGGQVVCELGDLAAGESATIVIEVNAPMTEGSLTNTAEAHAAETDPDLANNTVSVDVEVFLYRIYLPIITR